MGDLRDPKERQRFLQEQIDRLVAKRKMTEKAVEEKQSGWYKAINMLAEMLEDKEETEYRQLIKKYRLRA